MSISHHQQYYALEVAFEIKKLNFIRSMPVLQELQQLGGWSSFEMVLRYAHLSSEHLKQAAKRIQRNTGYEQQLGMNLSKYPRDN